MRSLVINDNWGQYGSLLQPYGEVENYETELCSPPEGTVKKLKGIDVVMFTGGQDVHPAVYNHYVLYGSLRDVPLRDMAEAIIFARARKEGIPTIGICRGAQFLCAMHGGALFQDVNNHTRTHLMDTIDGERFAVTSTHHQMMDVRGTKHKLIGWATERQSDKYLTEAEQPDLDTFKEPEVVIFGDEYKSLAVQYHPEYMPEDSLGRQYFYKLFEEFMEMHNNG